MKAQTSRLKSLFNIKVLVALMAMVLVVSYFSFSASVVKVNKAGYSTVAQSVYATPNSKAKKIGSLKKNQAVHIYVHNGSWSQIKYGNKKAWVAKKNLKLGKYVPPVTTVNKDGHALSNQYLYTSQSTKGKRLLTVKKNQNVYITASQNGWYKVKVGKSIGWVVAKQFKVGKYVPPATTVNKDGHALSNQYLYASQSTKGKRLLTVKTNQNIYVLASQNGWYKMKVGNTTGWAVAKQFKLGKYVSKPTTGGGGTTYPGGWKAPILKSKWSADPLVNYRTLVNELGFTNGGSRYALPEYPQGVIHVVEQGGKNVDLVFFTWKDSALPNSYRVPVVAKELFKLYFAKDADRVWNYCENGNIPDNFTANGFKVKVVASSATGAVSFMLR